VARSKPVGRDRGLALEESQSLLFEMKTCAASVSFVKYLKPLLENTWQVSVRNGARQSLPGISRGEAQSDSHGRGELTYPVHIMLRIELEKKILDGVLPVADLPEAWNANLEQRLNIRPANMWRGACRTSIGPWDTSATSPSMRWARSSPVN